MYGILWNMTAALHHPAHPMKMGNPYFRWRAALMDRLTRDEDYTVAELAERFCLDPTTVQANLKAWREREEK